MAPAGPHGPQPLSWSTGRGDLARVLAGLLDDGTGTIPDGLRGLWLDLISMAQPGRGLIWIRNNPVVAQYLQGLARGDIPVTHAGLSALPSWRTAAHLRDLLMAAGALPDEDRQILLFERWHRQRPPAGDPGHARILREFVTWRLMPALSRKASRGPLTNGSRNTAATSVIAAEDFLAWLAGRGRQPGQATQTDIDDWHVQRTGPERLRPFLTWAISTRRTPRLDIPPLPRTARSPVTQQQRLALLHTFLTSEQISLRTRVAACLVLLYAQPVVRLTRLTVADVITAGSGVTLRLGVPPVPVPEPFAMLLVKLISARANMNTASNPACGWLFPGGRAGQPVTPGALLQQLRAYGVPVTRVRTAAFRELVLSAPAPVVATALGYSQGTAAAHVSSAGGTWSRYPATRKPPHRPSP